MTHREQQREATARARATIFVILVVLAILGSQAEAATLDFTIQPTATLEPGDIPATGAGALTAHRVQYGTCNGSDFGQVLGELIVTMPRLAGSFTVPAGLYCVRAFASNAFGEGKPYPVSVIGPVPSDGGSIIVLRQAP